MKRTAAEWLQRTIDHSAFFLLPGCDCCDLGIVVVCHTRGETPKGTGDVSRLDIETGDVAWTYDCGIDSVTGTERKVPVKVIVGSDRNIYVLWQLLSFPYHQSAGGPTGGVIKLTPQGEFLDEVVFDTRGAQYDGSWGELQGWIREDPSNANQFWVGVEVASDQHFLHLLDLDLNILASYGRDEFEIDVSDVYLGVIGMAVTSVGDVWVSLLGVDNVYLAKIAADGTLLWSIDPASSAYIWAGGSVIPANATALAVDALDRLAIGGRSVVSGGLFWSEFLLMDSDLPTNYAWYKLVQDWPAPTGYSVYDWGESSDAVTYENDTSSAVAAVAFADGTGQMLFGLSDPAEWVYWDFCTEELGVWKCNDLVKGVFSLFAISAGGGIPAFAQSWHVADGANYIGPSTAFCEAQNPGDPLYPPDYATQGCGTINAIFDIANVSTLGTFVAGYANYPEGGAGAAGRSLAARMNGAGVAVWHNQILLDAEFGEGDAPRGVGIAVRE